MSTLATEAVVLRAGPLTALFEPEIGFLRYVRLGSIEIVRGIYGAVREPEWGTPTPEISGLTISAAEASFEIRFSAHCRTESIDFRWETEITGSADGTVRYTFTGAAGQAFLTARTGLCLLHPVLECAGRPCEVEYRDGSINRSRFPGPVSPHQPFIDFRAITHEVLPGLLARLELDGDTFEMEDQRNWTDASFKTYSRLLSLPKPYQLSSGEPVRQSITLRLLGSVPEQSPGTGEEPVRIVLATEEAALPTIGLGLGEPLPDEVLERLRPLRPAHLRVDLRLGELIGAGRLEEELSRADQTAHHLGAGLEAALFVSDEAGAELESLLASLQEARPRIVRWLLFHETQRTTPGAVLQLARLILHRHDAAIPIGGGTNLYLAELHRNPPPLEAMDLVAFSINPQVHAFDDRTLAENLEGQAHAAGTASSLAAGRPLCVSPVTLRPRFNAEASFPSETDLAFSIDPRQHSLFAAGWTVGSLGNLALSADSVTYFELAGPRGVADANPSGGVYPIFHVLADVADYAGGHVIECESSRPLDVACLALQRPSGAIRFLLANLRDHPIRVQRRAEGIARVRLLDASNVAAAMQDPEAFRANEGSRLIAKEGGFELELPPYALARIDLEHPHE